MSNQTRRGFFAALLAVAAVAIAPDADAKGRRRSGGGKARRSGGRGGCGSRGGAGYRKANGKCAGRNE